MENKKITLQELADVISAQSGTTKRFTDSFLRELVLVVQEYLEKDGVVKVKGLGTFKLLWIEARKSVNVATKETIILPAHYKLSFSAEENVKQELNSFGSIISGGATIIQDSENEAEQIEVEVENVETTEVPINTYEAEEKKVVASEENNEKTESPKVEVLEGKSKKINKGLVAIIILLIIVIVCLSTYIIVPNIGVKLMGIIKPTMHETNFEVISTPVDSVKVEEVKIEEQVKDSIKEEVVEEVKAESIITVDNYTPDIAKNAPTREVVTVIDGSRLTMVAYRAYGHKAFWVYVYDANRDRLTSPSAVEKGMQLRIADLPKSLVNSKDKRCLDKAYELARIYDK